MYTINHLKKAKNAIILAHYYTLPEVQEVADFVGDSLALAHQAMNTDAEIILFAGVHFMAETAKILSPQKKVLIPDLKAGCSLADSCTAEQLKLFLKNYPNHTVLSYINCSAKVKTISDIIVTSGNALKIVNALPENEKIVFTPDKNLGAYINKETGREMVLWDGACHVHDRLTAAVVLKMKEEYPNAKVLAHPECKATVLALADFIGSTAAMLVFTKNNSSSEFIVATETGILYEMQKQNPTKRFYVVNNPETCTCNDCEYMKMNTLGKTYNALLTESPEIILEEEIIYKAMKPIQKMLKY
jgi:quinolinate synthase